MSYKTTRTYDFKLINQLIDFDSLVDNAFNALSEFSTNNEIEGHIGCSLDLPYYMECQNNGLHNLQMSKSTNYPN